MEIHYVVDNVRTQLLGAGIIEYIVDALRVEDSAAKIISLRATIALAKYGARSIPLDLIFIITNFLYVGDARQIFTEASVIDDLFTLFRGTNWVIWVLSIRAISSLENHSEQTRFDKVGHRTETLQSMTFVVRSEGLTSLHMTTKYGTIHLSRRSD